LIGQITADPGGRLRVRLSADYERLKFLRVLRHYGAEPVSDTANILSPVPSAILHNEAIK
jgi:rod shape-determining protein MreC